MVDPLYKVTTNGLLDARLLWDHGTIIGVPVPGTFIMRVAVHRLPDLMKERGIVRVEALHEPYTDLRF